MPDDLILRETADGVMTVTLNRPEKLNALTSVMAADLLEALHAAERDPSVSAVLIRGAGRSFCAGLDLKEIGSVGIGAGFISWVVIKVIKGNVRRAAMTPAQDSEMLHAQLFALRSLSDHLVVIFDEFQRLGLAGSSAIDSGVLTIGRLEIARLDNDPNFAERGVLRLTMEGGR